MWYILVTSIGCERKFQVVSVEMIDQVDGSIVLVNKVVVPWFTVEFFSVVIYGFCSENDADFFASLNAPSLGVFLQVFCDFVCVEVDWTSCHDDDFHRVV